MPVPLINDVISHDYVMKPPSKPEGHHLGGFGLMSTWRCWEDGAWKDVDALRPPPRHPPHTHMLARLSLPLAVPELSLFMINC